MPITKKPDLDDRLLPTWAEFRSMPAAMRRITYLLMSVIFVVAFVIVSNLMPYDPWEFHGYTLSPMEVCEDDTINVAYKAAVFPGPYKLGSVVGTAYWVDDEGKPSGAIYPVNIPLDSTNGEIKEFVSPVERETPSKPGKWRIAADVVPTGRMFWLVPVQGEEKKIRSEAYVTVLDDSDPKCIAKEKER